MLTVILETAAARLLGLKTKNDLLTVVLVNVMTNPIVVCFSFLSGFFFGNTVRGYAEAGLEAFAFISEALVYRKILTIKKINPFLLSLILNGVSYGVGLVLNHFNLI